MIRRQRGTHLRVWTAIAVLLPLALGIILVLAAGQVVERVPQRLEPPVTGLGGGG